MKAPEKVRITDTRALYEKLFECAPDAILVVNTEGRILEANPQAETLFGYECTELLGSPVEILVPDRFRQVHTSHRKEYEKEPWRRPMSSALELFGKRKDGSEFPVDVLLSPVQTEDGPLVLAVIRDISEPRRLEEELRRLVLCDALTGLANYRRLQEAFETETKWYQRTGRSCALLLLDVNGLKKINDTLGHLAGNRALCRLADAMRAECRSVDIAVRHGGDEFAVLLPDSNAAGALSLACRIGTRLAGDSEDPTLSFCSGIAVLPLEGKTLEELLEVADSELCEMKKSKR